MKKLRQEDDLTLLKRWSELNKFMSAGVLMAIISAILLIGLAIYSNHYQGFLGYMILLFLLYLLYKNFIEKACLENKLLKKELRRRKLM